MESLFVREKDKTKPEKWQGEESPYIFCPICGRGNGTTYFLRECEYSNVPYQDTIICYDCLSVKKSLWLKCNPGCVSDNFKKISDEDFRIYTEMLDAEDIYGD